MENIVQGSRHRLAHDARAFADLAALNVGLQQRYVAMWQELAPPEQPRYG